MASEKVKDVNEFNFGTLVLGSPVPVLVDFTAKWCPPCKALVPVVERIAEQTWGRVRVCTVDTDEYPDLASRYGIRGMPTLVVFSHGRETARRIGLTNEAGVRKLLAAGGQEDQLDVTP